MSEAGRLGWVIVYVPDVERAIDLYERAFGLTRAFVDPSGHFGQLATGETALAFAHESLAGGNFPGGVQYPRADGAPFNVELALVFDDVAAAFATAVEAGCTPLAAARGEAPRPDGRLGQGPLRHPHRGGLAHVSRRCEGSVGSTGALQVFRAAADTLPA